VIFSDSEGGINYGFWLSEGILRPPHPERVGPALVLYAYLERRVTKTDGPDGLVLRGKPLADEAIAAEMGLSRKKITRMRQRLARFGYIALKRTPHGYTYRVKKSKKSPLARAAVMDGNGKSQGGVIAQKRPGDTPKTARRWTETGHVDQSSEGSLEGAVAETAAAESEPWKAIGQNLPIGTQKFQATWKQYFSTRNGHPLSEAMERCIQQCNSQGLKVPPPFYQAKRDVEKREREALAPPERELVALEVPPA